MEDKQAVKILIVDDDKYIRSSLRRIFEDCDYTVIEAESGQRAIEIVESEEVDLIIMDIKMPDMNGIDALKKIKELRPKQFVIIMTGYGTTQTAIEAMKYGAFDYILKPFDDLQLWGHVEKALKLNQSMKRNVEYREEKYDVGTTDYIVGRSQKMQEVYKLIGQVADKDITVLIRGDSGTGKELVARAIYQNSKRNNKTFLAVNCAAIPETLLESELFGHEKGAFTDAYTRRMGKFEQCHQGTLFLDEIGDVSLPIQSKILRVLQDKKITRLGSNQEIPVDVRLIVATNQNLEELIKQGRFREDLYYRLNVVTISLPPLRERKEDIPELVQFFVSKFNREFNRSITGIEPQVMERLSSYNWPGNVRELENVLKRAYVLCKGNNITLVEFTPVPEAEPKEEMKIETGAGEEDFDMLMNMVYKMALDMSEGEDNNAMSIIEKEFIKRALRETEGNQLKAAQLLGMNRNTLFNKMKKYGLMEGKQEEQN